MTAIEALLLKAAELNSSVIEKFGPAFAEIASARTAMTDALMPFIATAASVSGTEPFRYGFVLPSEPPAIKAEPGEAPKDPARSEVSLGPINVYAVAGEIQKALQNVGHDSTDIRAIYSSYATPAMPATALPPAAGRSPGVASREPQARPGSPPAAPVAGPKAPEVSADEWVEKSIRRSNVVMSDLSEVHQSIIDRTVTVEKVREISAEAQAIGAAVVSGHTVPALPEKQARQTEEPARTSFSYLPLQPADPGTRADRPQVAQQKPEESRPAYAGHGQVPARETAMSAGTQDNAPSAGPEALPGKIVRAPPLRVKPKMVPPAEESEYNAMRLSEARSVSAESNRPFRPAENTEVKEESPARISWPVVSAPVARESRVPETPRQMDQHVSHAGSIAPAHGSRREPALPGSPVVQVIRSMGAMGEYVRAVSEIGRAPSIAHGSIVSQPAGSAGLSMITAMSGVSAAAQPVIPAITEAQPAEIGRLITSPAASAPIPSPDVAAIEKISPPIPGYTGSMVQNAPAAGATRVLVPTMGLAAGIAAAQAGQRSGMAMVRHLIQSAPHVTGSVVPQAPVVYDTGRGLPWTAPVTPAVASGAENIVNITVPGAGPAGMSEHNTTSKVSNFHNTFNITVNVKGGEERELKELGKKIGQILSEEIKRYGGI